METTYTAWSREDGRVVAGRIGLNVIIDNRIMPHTADGVVHVPFGPHALAAGVRYGLQIDNFAYDQMGCRFAPARRTYAAVTLDGDQRQGEWIVRAGHTGARVFTDITGRNGFWTLFAARSAAGQAVGAGQVRPGDHGLIAVRFTPEWVDAGNQHHPGWVPPAVPLESAVPDDDFSPTVLGEEAPRARGKFENTRGGVAGVTGVTGQSNIQFDSAADFTRDGSALFTLYLRLVCDIQDGGPRPLPGRRPPSFPI